MRRDGNRHGAALAARMTGLSDSAVKTDALKRSGGLGGGVMAILAQIAASLERLAQSGEKALIDLHSLPLSAADRSALRVALGRGEVHATLDAQGESSLRETSFAGVWWTEHRDRDGAVTSELLEVTRSPMILMADIEEIARAAAALRQRIATAHRE